MKSRPCVRQIDETDCGAACIATICQYYGMKIDLDYIKKISYTDKYGSSMLGLYNAALEIGFLAEGLSGNIENLIESKIQTPYIAHIITESALEHYVVVLKMEDSKFIISDPAKGIIELLRKEFEDVWTGHILTIQFINSKKIKVKSKNALLSFSKVVTNHKKEFVVIVLLSICIIVLNISTTLFFNYLLDSIIPQKLSVQLKYAFLCLIFIHILLTALNFIRIKVVSLLTNLMNNDIMNQYIFKALHIQYNFYEKYTTGDMISRLQDTDIVREALSQVVSTIFLDVIMMFVGLGVLIYINTRLFYIAIVTLICYGIVVFAYDKVIYTISMELRRKEAGMTTQFIETVNGIEVIKAYQTENYMEEKNLGKIASFIQIYSHGMFVFSGQSVLSNAVMSIGEITVLTIGGVSVINSEMTIGTLITFYSLFSMCILPVKNIIDLLPTIRKAEVSAKRLKEIYDEKEDNLPLCPQDYISLLGDIEIINISFAYGNRKPILENCSFTIKKGEKIALVGNSGSGKSTIARLLLRLYEPGNGNIKINGYNITEIPVSTLRKKIAYIPQNIFLFQGSILENIRMGDTNIKDDYIISFFQNTPIEDSIQQLAAGYNTILTEHGNNLSGGQKQIVALARAMIKRADIFILDEATSALDMQTRKAVEQMIKVMYHNVIIIFITHQLDTINICDSVYLLKNKEIIPVHYYGKL